MEDANAEMKRALEAAGFSTSETPMEGSLDLHGPAMTPPNRIEELSNELFQAKQIHLLESRLDSFNPSDLAGAEKESWYHLNGVAAFNRGDRNTALERFTEAHKTCPDSGMIAFSLGQELEHVGKIEPAIELFDSALFPKIPSRHALAQARYAYLWGRPDKMLQYTLPILDAYYKLKIADDTFLYMRGLPFFSQTWGYLAAACELTGDLTTLRRITEEASRRLSAFNFDVVKMRVLALEQKDFNEVLASSRSLIEKLKRGKHPIGYTAMQIAVIECQQAKDVVAAEDILSALQLGANDFPWLNDIRLLAQCEVAHRFADSERERKLQDEFFKRQPLLFQSDHAFNFRLLSYQELLKPRYQSERRSSTNP